MTVKPLVIDLGWGALKTAIVALEDASFVAPREAAVQRDALLRMYVDAFRRVEASALGPARSALNDLGAAVASRVVATGQQAIRSAIDRQLAKI